VSKKGDLEIAESKSTILEIYSVSFPDPVQTVSERLATDETFEKDDKDVTKDSLSSSNIYFVICHG